MNRQDFDLHVARTPFFLGLSDNHLALLARCASRTHFDEGQIVFNQGETANRFYLIQSGSVQLETISSSDGTPVVVDTIGAGDLLGWSWLFEPFQWQFSARAACATESIFFYGTVLREHCQTEPSFGFELLKRMSEVMMKRLQATRHVVVAAKTGFSPIGREHAIR